MGVVLSVLVLLQVVAGNVRGGPILDAERVEVREFPDCSLFEKDQQWSLKDLRSRGLGTTCPCISSFS